MHTRTNPFESEICRREGRAAVVALMYLIGLVAVPVLMLHAAVAMGSSLAGAPLALLLFVAYTQKVIAPRSGPYIPSTPDADGAGEPTVPLYQLGRPLEAVLERLAAKVGGPVPSVVLLSPDMFAAGWLPIVEASTLSWSVTWVPVLILGVFPMRSLSRPEMEAILAHELGHLARKPGPMGSFFALALEAAESLRRRGELSTFQSWANPGCWWTRLCWGVLDSHVVGLGRLEELRADHDATCAVGADALGRALDAYVERLAQLKALAVKNAGSPADMRAILADYFKMGTTALPPAADPTVSGILRAFHAQRSTSHPTNKARKFIASRHAEQGTSLPDDSSSDGCLHLLPDGARGYLTILVRYLVSVRHQLARAPIGASGPWAVCQDSRAKMRLPGEPGEVPQWHRDETDESGTRAGGAATKSWAGEAFMQDPNAAA
jgi:hypothetical protein